MSETEILHIKSLSVKLLGDDQARIEAKLRNPGRSATPPLLLLLYFYDEENRIRDRINIRIKASKPGEIIMAGATFRLKNTGCFTYIASLEKSA
jgi:hypothetical protein